MFSSTMIEFSLQNKDYEDCLPVDALNRVLIRITIFQRSVKWELPVVICLSLNDLFQLIMLFNLQMNQEIDMYIFSSSL